MAFRNSVKATLLLEAEQPRSRFDEPGPLFEPPAPVAPRGVENVAQPATIAPPAPEDDALPGAAWQARAAELRAMADTLPSKTTRALMPKIAAIYDDLASEAAPPEPDALPPDDRLPEVPSVIAPPAEPCPTERLTFPRRPLPQGRPIARRRG